MKLLKYAICAAATALALVATEVQGKAKVVPNVYVFGFSASFTDSIVYFTDVQAVENAWIDSKTNFLLGRDNYSLQLKNHMTNEMGMPNRTCIVVFDTKKSTVEKELLKMKKQYTSTKGRATYDVRHIDPSSFKFKTIDMSFIEESEAEELQEKKTKKAERKSKGMTPGEGPGPGGDSGAGFGNASSRPRPGGGMQGGMEPRM